jgi:selenocysteine lyase/cysteine desulfurase
MVVRRDLGMRLPNQGHYFNAESLYKRFTPAGPDHAQVAACAGIADYIDALATHHGGGDLAPRGRSAMVHDLMRAHEIKTLQPLLDYLGSRNEVRVVGPRQAEKRAPTVAIKADRPGFELARALADHGVMAGGGDFYAVRALGAQGVNPDHGVLRVSFVHYTSPAEVDQLIQALDRVL